MSYTTINKSTDYFNTKLYTGNQSTNAITGVGFQPDLVWIKERSSTSSHRLIDAVRGVGRGLSSDSTGAEQYIAQLLTSFDSDGFTVDNDNGTNENSQTYASWNWLANGAGSSNTDGSITSTVSANTTSGFSIVSYTGTGSNATIGHGLSSAPKMIIVKCRSTDYNWPVYHYKNGNGNVQYLNLTNASASGSGFWNSTTPTSSVFSIGTDNAVNQSGETYIAYCFAEKKGFSKFGSYTGNGNADGTFVYTGFKPAFILSKRTDVSGQNWTIWDNKRSSSDFNPTDKILHPNVNNAENTADDTDFLSNGFKLRATALGMNASGSTYIYMAFAEAPLVGTNNVPCTAR